MTKKLIIDRALWLRGLGAHMSRLFRPDINRMCCIGIAGIQLCSLKQEDISGVRSPAERYVFADYDANMSWLFDDEERIKLSDDGLTLMVNNDRLDKDEVWREKSIADIFAKHDIEVEFVE